MRILLMVALTLIVSTGACAAENLYAKLDQQILKLLISQDFNKLESTLLEIIDNYEKNHRNEWQVDIAFDAFYRADSDLDSKLENWIKAKPNSYVAYVARGAYYTNLGWAKRKGKFIDKTTKEQLDGMKYYFQKAFKDLEQARLINKRALHPLSYEMEALMNFGEKEKIRKLYEEALQINPMSLTARWQYMTTILPRWSGSIEEMEKEVKSARPYYEKNPALKILDGRVAAELGDQASFKKNCAQAEQLYNEALKSGDHWYYYKQRGQNYYCMKKHDQSNSDLIIALNLRPVIANLYMVSYMMGNNYYALKKYSEAIPFLSNHITVESTDHKSIDLRGDSYLRLGKLDMALSDFEKAISLSPGNAEYLADRERVKRMMASTPK